jgi:hypothetical protein
MVKEKSEAVNYYESMLGLLGSLNIWSNGK